MAKKVEKQSVPVVITDDEPVAMIFYNKHRDRVIYMLERASEEDLIDLIQDKNDKIN